MPRKSRFALLLAGLFVFATGGLFGFWFGNFFGEPPLGTPAPFQELADDFRDLLQGRELSEEPEPFPFPEGTEKERRSPESIDLASLYPDTVFRSGSRNRQLVALTFDDGPDATFTPPVLDVLKRYRVPATFFVTGVRAEQFPEVLKRIVDEGHVVANHGYLHRDYTTLTPRQIEEDLRRNNEIITRVTGHIPNIFRPPYGALDRQGVETIHGAGYKIILWDVDSLDWMNLSKEDVLDNVLPKVGNGSIILQHSAGGPGQDLTGTIEALPVIIEELSAQGYRFVTTHELLGLAPTPRR